MAFYDRLKKARKDKELSQIELATQIGVAKNTYSQYESGDRKPNFDTLKKLSDELGVSIDYLLEKSDYKTIYDEWDNKYNKDGRLNKEVELLEKKSKLRSVARLENSDFSDEEDKQISQYIEFLTSQRSQRKE
jgi:transcriptional regulator with XRE-family HTH domain